MKYVFVSLAVVWTSASAQAVELPQVTAQRDIMVPMRDGVRLGSAAAIPDVQAWHLTWFDHWLKDVDNDVGTRGLPRRLRAEPGRRDHPGTILEVPARRDIARAASGLPCHDSTLPDVQHFQEGSSHPARYLEQQLSPFRRESEHRGATRRESPHDRGDEHDLSRCGPPVPRHAAYRARRRDDSRASVAVT